jgi:hypothetical protein
MTKKPPRSIRRGPSAVCQRVGHAPLVAHVAATDQETGAMQASGTAGGEDDLIRFLTNKIRQRRPLSCHTLALPDLVFIVGHLKVTNQSEGWRYE